MQLSLNQHIILMQVSQIDADQGYLVAAAEADHRIGPDLGSRPLHFGEGIHAGDRAQVQMILRAGTGARTLTIDGDTGEVSIQ